MYFAHLPQVSIQNKKEIVWCKKSMKLSTLTILLDRMIFFVVVIIIVIVVIDNFAVRFARPNKNHGRGRLYVTKKQSYLP